MYKKLPRKFGVPALILPLVIAFSRLFIGHYSTDVLPGGMIAKTIALCTISYYKKMKFI